MFPPQKNTRTLLVACAMALISLANAMRLVSPIEAISDDKLDQPKKTVSTVDGLELMIRDYAESHSFNGVVLVQQDNAVIHHRAFGTADRTFDIPIRIDTRFRIASVTKAFTAVLVLQLFEEGKIDLDGKIRTYLPDYRGEAGDKSTIRNLLNHTSGMENFDSEIKSDEDGLKNGIPHYQLPFDTDRLIDRYCSGKLLNQPGKAFDYNNGDYIILGKVIEKVTGKSFDQVLMERITKPLRMTDTGMSNHRDIIKNIARTYMTSDGGKTVVNDLPVYFENWFASGSMYSNASNMVAFASALFDGKLIDEKSLKQMTTPALNDYGFSVWVGLATFGGKQYQNVNRPGGIMGANASMRHFHGIGFDSTVNIVILSNTDSTNLDDFSYQIGKNVLDPIERR